MALALVAAACGDDDDDDGAVTPTSEAEDVDEGEPQAGGEITVGLEAESNSWVPGESALSSAGDNIEHLIFDALLARAENGDVVPYLAESFEMNEELTELTLKLRSGIQFHDGTPANAESVKYSWDNLVIREGSNRRGAFTDNNELVTVEVVDDLTVKFVLPRANGAFPQQLIDPFLFSPAAHQQFGEDAGSNPVGTGPFKFVSWTRDDKLVLERNENYWQEGLPYLDKITFRPIPDEDTRRASLVSGEIDAMQTLRQSNVTQLLEAKEKGDIDVLLFLGSNGGGAIYNTLVPPVDDPRVRLGLAHAIDQDGLIDILGGKGITPPQTQYWSDESPWFSQKVADAWPEFDAEKAKELLDQYVNDPERSDGKAPGSPISVEFNCPPDPSLIELSQAYQAFWGNVGVDVKLNQVEQATHIQNALGSPDEDPPLSAKSTYMINCWRQGSDDDPYLILRETFGDPNTKLLNFTNYSHPVIDENVEILRTSTDFDERYKAAEEIMLLLAEEVPSLWTGHTAIAFGVSKELRGWRAMDLPDTEEKRLKEGEEIAVWWGNVWIAK